MKNIDELLCEIFRLRKDELRDNLTMEDVPRWDSLTHMELITSLEQEYNIELNMDDIMNMRDVATIKSIVNTKIGR